ncbi:MAG: S-layer homology domain-containing protein [Clostridia bacterium]|nr:S-layer homology domain-containing protein [Clostridia bacterium]
MKKILSLIILVLLVCTVAITPVFATMSTPDITFYPDTLKLEVRGTVSDSNNDTVALFVTRLAENEITTDAINSGKVFFVTAKTNRLGEYSISYKLANNTPGGQYYVYVSCNGEKTEGNFLFFNEFLAKEAVGIINRASKTEIADKIEENLADFGLEKAEFDTYSKYIGAIVYESKPIGGYDVDSFVNMYKTAVAVGSIKEGDKTLLEAITEHTAYIGVTIDEYNALEEEIKAETENLFKTLPYDSISFKAAFDEYVLLSKVRTAKDAENLGNVITTEHESLGIDLTKYNNIKNEYYQANVFINIYNSAKIVSDFESLKTLFDNEVKVQTEEAKDNKDKAPSSAGGGGGGGGGASIPKDSVNVFVPEVEEVVEVTKEDTTFTDIENHWAKDVITNFVKTEIITGYPDGTFKPNNTVTRAEFSVLIYKMLSLSPVFENQFGDVNEGDWFYKYINAVGSKGIVTGYDGIFNPNAPISRQDMAVMVYRMLESAKFDAEYSEFKDHNSISNYAVDAVYTLQNMDVISGSDGYFAPKSNATRAEAVKILSNALKYIEE